MVDREIIKEMENIRKENIEILKQLKLILMDIKQSSMEINNNIANYIIENRK